MNAIFKKENVYVIVDKNLRGEFTPEEVEELVYDYDSKYDVLLYGGRVHLKYWYDDRSVVIVEVDGISLYEISFSGKDGYSKNRRIALSKAVAFLNQMENLGIDSFLENYKSHLQEFKKDLEIQAEKIEQEQAVQFDENKLNFLTSLKKFINELTCIIYCLLINMNAGLDNQFYTDAYNEIINLYF